MATREIKTTSNYDQFKLIVGNRQIHEKHVMRVAGSIKEYGLLVPIIVNQDLEVLDGQHRLKACELLGRPVEYIVKSNIDMSAVQVMNTVQDKWKLMDCIESFAAKGNDNYKNMLRFHSLYGDKFPISSLLGIISDSQSRSIRDGSFKFTSQMALRAHEDAEKILEVGKYFKDATKFRFARVYRKILAIKDFSHDQFIAKLAKQRSSLYPCIRDAQYAKLVEDIYNYRRRTGFGIDIMKYFK